MRRSEEGVMGEDGKRMRGGEGKRVKGGDGERVRDGYDTTLSISTRYSRPHSKGVSRGHKSAPHRAKNFSIRRILRA